MQLYKLVKDTKNLELFAVHYSDISFDNGVLYIDHPDSIAYNELELDRLRYGYFYRDANGEINLVSLPEENQDIVFSRGKCKTAIPVIREELKFKGYYTVHIEGGELYYKWQDGEKC